MAHLYRVDRKDTSIFEISEKLQAKVVRVAIVLLIVENFTRKNSSKNSSWIDLFSGWFTQRYRRTSFFVTSLNVISWWRRFSASYGFMPGVQTQKAETYANFHVLKFDAKSQFCRHYENRGALIFLRDNFHVPEFFAWISIKFKLVICTVCFRWITVYVNINNAAIVARRVVVKN